MQPTLVTRALVVFAVGTLGMLLGRSWGYVLFGAAGACSPYINVILWFT